MSLVTESSSQAFRTSATLRLALSFGVLALLLGCSKEKATASNGGACQKDTDCKGDRICEHAPSGSQRASVPGGTCAVTSGLKGGTDHPVGTPRVVAAAPELTSRLAVYTTGYHSILAPRGWNCVGTSGADGSETIQVSPPSTDSSMCPFFPKVLKAWPEMERKKPRMEWSSSITSAAQATCTLPESDHALCTVVLNEFLHE